MVERARELLAAPGASSPGFRVERIERAGHDQEETTRERIEAQASLQRAEGELDRLSAETRNLTTLPDTLRVAGVAAHSGPVHDVVVR